MKFLIDNPVSPLLADALRRAGHEAVHVCNYQLQSADDAAISERATRERRVIITADTDFGLLLARRRTRRPSVLLFHHSFSHRPSEQTKILLENLPELTAALKLGRSGGPARPNPQTADHQLRSVNISGRRCRR